MHTDPYSFGTVFYLIRAQGTLARSGLFLKVVGKVLGFPMVVSD